MMENDDTLIKNFMLANKHEIEDNGFSRGVIRRLPQPAQWLSDILSVTCAIVCCALFYIFNGFEILCQTISDIVTPQTYYLVSDTNFQSLYRVFMDVNFLQKSEFVFRRNLLDQ